MTRKEAQQKVEGLEALHPWIGDYEWMVREQAEGDWIVVKVPVAHDVRAATRVEDKRSQARRRWRDAPPFGTA